MALPPPPHGLLGWSHGADHLARRRQLRQDDQQRALAEDAAPAAEPDAMSPPPLPPPPPAAWLALPAAKAAGPTRSPLNEVQPAAIARTPLEALRLALGGARQAQEETEAAVERCAKPAAPAAPAEGAMATLEAQKLALRDHQRVLDQLLARSQHSMRA